ncbi:MAG: hypothetical protein ABI904_19950 [Chloroflexota bacterium]
MRLRWRQTAFTWLAINPKSDDFRGSKLEKPINKAVKELCSHLIGIDGKIVVVEFHESPDFCKALVKLGELDSNNRLKINKGEDRECHINSAVLWSQNKDKYLLVTGFALSEDGVWRRHSWIRTKSTTIIETTIKRKKYYGITLNKELSESFWHIYH